MSLRRYTMMRTKGWSEEDGWALWFWAALIGWIVLSITVLMSMMPWYFALPLGVVVGLFLWLGLGILNGGTTQVEITIGSSIPLVFAIALVPLFAQARERAREATCRANLKELARALASYDEKHDNKPLPEKNWQAALTPYLPKKLLLPCPDSKGGYRYEAGRSGILFTECKPAHKGHRVTIFTDGTIRRLEVNQMPPDPALLARQ
jgi:Protein of unknown function (DUF1559)